MTEYEKRGAIIATSDVSAEVAVKRGLNGIRLTLLGVLVSIGLSVGFGVPGPFWVGLLAGAGSFAISCLLIWWNPSQHLLMSFMHRLTGL